MSDNDQFRISGFWSREQVKNTVKADDPAPDSMHEHATALFRKFSAGRAEAYDGTLVGLKKLQTENETLILTGSEVRFSDYLATRDPFHPEEWPRANPLGTTSVLVTSDNNVLVSVRSLNAEQNPGGLYFVGGFSEFSERGDFDIFDNACREIEEETGLDLSVVLREITLRGIDYDTEYSHPEAFFTGRLNISSAELNEHLRHHHHEEAEKFELLTKDDFMQVNSADRPLTWSFLTGRRLIADAVC